MRVFWLLMLLAGCPGDPGNGGTPDASDASGDGSPPPDGLYVQWRANPILPGAVSDRLSVSDVSLQVDHLQVSGDSGSAGTTRYRYMLAWSSEGAPGQDVFTDAPVALYSKVTLALMGGGLGDFSYQLHGTWTDDDTASVTPFSIRDRVPVTVTLMFPGKMLTPGSPLTLTIKVDLKEPLEGIDFKKLAGAGPIEVGGQDLIDFRARLQNAFEVD